MTCKVAKHKHGHKGVKVICRVKLLSSARAEWQLTGHNRTVARGRLHAGASHLALPRLAPGRYTLWISGRRAFALHVAAPGSA